MISVSIPGTPVAQGRGRATRTPAGRARVYDPERSRVWKLKAATHMRRQAHVRPVYGPGVPIWVDIVASWPIPAKGGRRDGDPRPSRPDADNITKAVLDAGNGILWADDAQVVALSILKQYGDTPGVVVKVSAVDDL